MDYISFITIVCSCDSDKTGLSRGLWIHTLINNHVYIALMCIVYVGQIKEIPMFSCYVMFELNSQYEKVSSQLIAFAQSHGNRKYSEQIMEFLYYL